MKVLAIVLTLSFIASAFAGDLSDWLFVGSELEIPSVVNPGSDKSAPIHSGIGTDYRERGSVSFGREAVNYDLALFEERADAHLVRLAKSVDGYETVQMRHSTAPTQDATGVIQASWDESTAEQASGLPAMPGRQLDFLASQGSW